MEVSEVLRRRYKAGERNFCGEALRGQSLKGQNLSGADFTDTDFSKADIRGVNFNNAILKNANFAEAKAGVEKQWLIIQLILSLLLSALLNFVVGYFNAVNLGTYFQPQVTNSLGGTPAVFVLFVIIGTFWAVVQQGLKIKAVRTIAITTLIAIITGSLIAAVAMVAKGIGAGQEIVVVAGAVIVAAVAFAIAAAAFAIQGAIAAMFVIATAVTVAIVVAGLDISAIAVMLVIIGAVVGTTSIGHFLHLTGAGSVVVTLISVAAGMIAVMLFSFYLAWRSIHGDEKFAFIHKFGLAFGALGGTNFCGADLTAVNFRNATLKGTNFASFQKYGVKLDQICWENAKGLDRATVGDSNLSNSAVRELLITRNGSKETSYVKADLRGTDLSGADLSGVDLRWADLRGAKLIHAKLNCAILKYADLSQALLHHAELEGSNLTQVQAIGTDFRGASMTGACLEAWNIDSSTNLQNVDAKFVYLREGKQERRPSISNFASGEFTTLFQEALNTVDLIFRDGVDWQAFFLSFQKLRDQYGDENLSIQAIEKKADRAFVIRLEVSPEADKAAIEQSARDFYTEQLSYLEARYQDQLRMQGEQIEYERQHNTQLIRVVETMAENTGNRYDFRNATIGNVADTVKGNAHQQTKQYNYASPEKQSLAEAAAEIQKLLKVLEQTNPTATEAEQQAFVSAAIPTTLKQRAVKALQSGGKVAIAEFLDNPYLNVAIAIVEGWRDNNSV